MLIRKPTLLENLTDDALFYEIFYHFSLFN